ncbi:hypothetical protein Slin14017_G000100 [Septoria linicola]|nr:hypothetical protein Slin14017_G000100 [Septoria linicola]
MFHATMDKRPSTPSSSLQEPRQAHLDHRNTFLPTYEEHLNDALHSFSPPESQVNLKSFDHIEEPKRGRRQCMKREYLIIVIVMLLVCAIALPIGLVYILHRASTDHEVSQSFSHTPYFLTETDFALPPQPSTLQTRQAESSFSYVSITTPPLATAVVPFTVYVTVTPTPQVSVTIVAITVTEPSDSASSSDAEEQSTTTAHATGTLTRLSVSISTLAPSTIPSSTFSINPSQEAIISSAPVPSSLSTSTSAPDTETSTETQTDTITSPTTLLSLPPTPAAKTMQTIHSGRFGFCGVRGSSC